MASLIELGVSRKDENLALIIPNSIGTLNCRTQPAGAHWRNKSWACLEWRDDVEGPGYRLPGVPLTQN